MKVLWNTLSRDSWCREARKFRDSSLYQQWDYGVQHCDGLGRSVVHVAVHNGTRIGAMAQCRIKRLPFLRGGVAEVDWGPLWRLGSESDAGAVMALLKELRQRLVGRQRLRLKITPRVEDSECAPRLSDMLVEAGFQLNRRARAYRTVCIDLRDSIVDIRKRFQQKWRNGLNAAERKGLTVAGSCSTEAFSAFEETYWAMWKRKRFPTGVRIPSIRRIQGLLPREDKLQIWLAFADGTCVAGHVTTCLGDTCVYFLGATTEAGRQLKAAYVLQWAVLENAKRLGFRWYDLGGIDPDAIPGVASFKRGMSGTEVQAPGQFELSPPCGGSLWYEMSERAYRSTREALQRGFRIRERLHVNGH